MYQRVTPRSTPTRLPFLSMSQAEQGRRFLRLPWIVRLSDRRAVDERFESIEQILILVGLDHVSVGSKLHGTLLVFGRRS